MLCAALLTTGCAAAPPVAGTGAPPRHHIDNCGIPVAITGTPPERVVTIKSTSTEMLLALGVEESIVGVAFQDGPVPERWKARAARLPVISEQLPSLEALLELEPDFVYAGWESNLSEQGVGSRMELAGFGIRTFVSPLACRGAGYAPSQITFERIFAEISQVAQIFAVDPAPVLDEQRAMLASIEPDERGLTALWYSSGIETPYVGAGLGAPQLVMSTIGLTNIAADIDDTWASWSWESVVDADPDVIVLVDAAWRTAEEKMQILRENPATARLKAVQENRFLIVPFAASEAGVRTVEAAAGLREQLEKLRVG